MKKAYPSCLAAALVAGGLLFSAPTAATAAPVDSFGVCVPSDEKTTTVEHPAVGEPTIVVPNPDYVPAVPEVPGVPAVGTPTIIVDNPDYVPAVPGTPGVPAIGEPTVEVPNPDYVPAIPGTDAVPAVGEPTITVPNPEYVPAVPATPGTPAIGEPTIEIENPEYVPAVPAIPAKPAVGEPTIVVPNPDYVPAQYFPAHTVWVPPVYTPAVGKPTMIVTVPNPDYKPAVPEVAEVSHTDYRAKRYVVDAPAQEAVFKTQWKYVKHGGHGEIWVDNNNAKYVDGNGNPVDFWDYPKYERTSKTRQVEVSPAIPEQGHWEENHFHEHPGDGWTILSESKHVTQEYVPGSPAEGSETIEQEVTNPDYVAPTYTPGYHKEIPAKYIPAVGSKTITIDNPDYQPATPEIPGTDAVGEPTIVVPNPEYVPAVPGTDEIPAVGEPTITIENPDYVPEIPAVPGTPAVGEPTLVVENPAYVPAVPAVDEIPAVGEPTLEVENPEYVPAIPAVPGTPAEGTETIITLNPDYEPAWVETVTVPAVECPVIEEPKPEEPKVEEPAPAPKPAVKAAAPAPVAQAAAEESEDTLAVTGFDKLWGFTLGSVGVALAGLGGVMAFKRRRDLREATVDNQQD